jgi:hypothetical protein
MEKNLEQLKAAFGSFNTLKNDIEDLSCVITEFERAKNTEEFKEHLTGIWAFAFGVKNAIEKFNEEEDLKLF